MKQRIAHRPLTNDQKRFIFANYAGLSNSSIISILQINEGQLNVFLGKFSPKEMAEKFKHLKPKEKRFTKATLKVVQREVFDALVEPDMTPVDHSMQIIGTKTIYTFQSRINY